MLNILIPPIKIADFVVLDVFELIQNIINAVTPNDNPRTIPVGFDKKVSKIKKAVKVIFRRLTFFRMMVTARK